MRPITFKVLAAVVSLPKIIHTLPKREIPRDTRIVNDIFSFNNTMLYITIIAGARYCKKIAIPTFNVATVK